MLFLTYGSRFAKKNSDALQYEPWKEAFQKQHDFDAHAWSYVLTHPNGEHVPPFRVGGAGGKLDFKGLVQCNFMFLDYDSPKKEFDHADILDTFFKAQGQVADWTLIYPTKGGVRIVYRLAAPVLAQNWGPVVRGLAFELWRQTGLQVDPSTDQWYRCFRLPNVQRDDEKAKGPTWKEPYWFEAIWNDGDPCISAGNFQRADKLPWDPTKPSTQGGGRAARPAQEDMPEHAEVFEERRKVYIRALKMSRYIDYLLMNATIPEGRRDGTLLAMAGEFVAKVFVAVPDATAEELFNLVRPVAEALAGDAGSESWEQKLWRFIRHAWNGENQKVEQASKKHLDDLSNRDVFFRRMAEKMPEGLLPVEEAARQQLLDKMLCLQTSAGAFVVGADGDYLPVQLSRSQIPAHFNNGLTYLSEDGFRNDKGKMMSGQEILNEHSTNVDDIEYVAGDKKGTTLRVQGSRKVLEVVPFTLRQDLMDSAELDQEIGEWLSSFNDSIKLQRWLASAVALQHGPTAACYLVGPARVGKSMLAMALAEAFDTMPCTGTQAFDTFNGALLNSPIVMVDEGLPAKVAGMDTADLFRTMVTGGPLSVRDLYKAAVNSRVPYRVLFAANSFDLVRHLIGKRSMNHLDREALRERILVIETGDKPANYLDRRGAMQFTRHSPKGSWIGGKCRLARHILKLYQLFFLESPFISDGRLLVQGEHNEAFLLNFTLSGAGKDIVSELMSDCLKVILGKGGATANVLRWADGAFWIKKYPWIKMVEVRTPKLRTDTLSLALGRFLTENLRPSAIDGTQEVAIDLQKLVACARELGISTAELDEARLRKLGVG